MELKQIVWKQIDSEVYDDITYYSASINDINFILIYTYKNKFKIKIVYLKKHKNIDEEFSTLNECKIYSEELIKKIIFNYFE